MDTADGPTTITVTGAGAVRVIALDRPDRHHAGRETDGREAVELGVVLRAVAPADLVWVETSVGRARQRDHLGGGCRPTLAAEMSTRVLAMLGRGCWWLSRRGAQRRVVSKPLSAELVNVTTSEVVAVQRWLR